MSLSTCFFSNTHNALHHLALGSLSYFTRYISHLEPLVVSAVCDMLPTASVASLVATLYLYTHTHMSVCLCVYLAEHSEVETHLELLSP